MPAAWVWAGLLYPALLTQVYFVVLRSAPEGVQQAVYGVGKVLQFALPVVAVWWVARRRRGPIRLPSVGWWPGLLFGLLVGATIYGLYRWLATDGSFDGPAAAVRERLTAIGVDSFPVFLGVAAGYCLVHSLLEEYYWRWFVFGELSRRMSMPVAVAVSSLGFTLHHVIVIGLYFGFDAFSTYLFSAGVGVGGAFWAWLYRRSGSLLAPWLSHALVDAGIFLVAWELSGLG